MTTTKLFLSANCVQPGREPVHMLSNKMHVHRSVQVTKILCVLKLPGIITMN